MPDRHESTAFLQVALAHDFTWRMLRNIHKPELLTPVSIYQLVLGHRPSPQLLHAGDKQDSRLRQHTQQTSPASTYDAARTEASPTVAAASASPHAVLAGKELQQNAVSVNHVQLASGSRTRPTATDTHTDAIPDGQIQPASRSPAMPAATEPQQDALSVSQVQLVSGTSPMPTMLLVLDFDWSMIEENSDTFVVRELGAWEAFQRYC